MWMWGWILNIWLKSINYTYIQGALVLYFFPHSSDIKNTINDALTFSLLLSSMYLKKRKISVVLKYITVIICKLSNDFLHLEVPNVSLLSPKSSQLIISASSIPSLNTHNAWVRLLFFIIFISSSTLLRDIGSSSVLTTRPYRTSSSVDLGQGAVGIPRQGLAPGSISLSTSAGSSAARGSPRHHWDGNRLSLSPDGG